MKKIEYFDNCEITYLCELGFWDKTNCRYTQSYWNLNKEWNALRNKYSLLSLPKNVSKLLISNYQRLVSYFVYFDDFIDKECPLDNYSKKTDYNKAVKDLLEPFLETFNYSIKFSEKEKQEKQERNETIIPPYSDLIRDYFKNHSKELGLYSCFYCEASYTGIFYKDKIKGFFDVDHFFQKEQYPIFALSLYNFVPCCQYCNSRIKGRTKFIDFYTLDKKIKDNIQILNQISPTSSLYDFDNNTKIHMIFSKNPSKTDEWQYSDDLKNYEVCFDCDQESPYKKVIKAFNLEERYNCASIKTHAIYLENLKIKYPQEHISEISKLLSEGGYPISEEQIKNAIFHTDEKYQLLEKLRKDILEYSD